MAYKIRTYYEKCVGVTLMARLVCEQCDSCEEINVDSHNRCIFEVSIGNYSSEIKLCLYIASDEGLKELEKEVSVVLAKAYAYDLVKRRRYLEKKFKPFNRLIEM